MAFLDLVSILLERAREHGKFHRCCSAWFRDFGQVSDYHFTCSHVMRYSMLYETFLDLHKKRYDIDLRP